MSGFSDRNCFALAVLLYGISAAYSIFLLRREHRPHNRLNYFLLLGAFGFHTVAMLMRGFSLDRCPINNLYEATTFVAWTMTAAYLALGLWSRLRFLG
ncbi:MAG TPA: cytochrome c assembly protein, partial [Verrucomicrobiae bacterium]